jgi:hypothetical protein
LQQLILPEDFASQGNDSIITQSVEQDELSLPALPRLELLTLICWTSSSVDQSLDFDVLAPLLGEELPEVLDVSARVETLAAFLLSAILNAADILGKIVLITEYQYCGRSTGGNGNDG